jgi:coenzyme F420-reducing hydrogenase delta subunit
LNNSTNFKPKIIGFLCNWCCYGGADLCGVSRFQYPPYIRVIRVMCAGRVDPAFVLRAFERGIDGVFIGGCHFNDCHYNTEGNYDAFSMVQIMKRLLGHIGINPERLRLEWVSAGEGTRFAEIMNEYGNKIQGMGPLGLESSMGMDELKSGIATVTGLIPYIKEVERKQMRIRERSEEAYRAFFTSERFDKIYKEHIEQKLKQVDPPDHKSNFFLTDQ